MNGHFPGHQILVEVGVSYAQAVHPEADQKLRGQIAQHLGTFITGACAFDDAYRALVSLIGRGDPVVKVRDILKISQEPFNLQAICSQSEADASKYRKKNRAWSGYEDQRLIAGIFLFGLDNWPSVSAFVGNNRTRAQCAQRYARELNPKLSKKAWTQEEDAALINLVQTNGDKAWTKISSLLGNRSDVQCRYHYFKIEKASSGKVLHQSSAPVLPPSGLSPRPRAEEVPMNSYQFKLESFLQNFK